MGDKSKTRAFIHITVLGLLLYIIAFGFTGLQGSIEAISKATVGLLLIAEFAVIMSYVCATLTYLLLADYPIRFWPTFVVQLASGLINRLLPGGLGGLGLNALYLKRMRHTLPAATAIVTSNNILGFVGNAVILGGTVLFLHVTTPTIRISKLLILISLVLAVVGMVAIRLVRKSTSINARVKKARHEIGQYIRTIINKPLKLTGALLSSCALTSCHVLALYMVLQAIHSPVALSVAVIAISVGALTGAAIPSPGGLGTAEAGIAGALLSYGVSSSSAITAAVVFRGLTYWLPLLPGYIAFRLAEKRYL